MGDLDYFAARVVYPSIFAETTDAAARNLADLITNGLCGLEEGPRAWRVVLERFASREEALDRLAAVGKRMSAPFTRDEWREVADKTREYLNECGGG